MTIKKNKIWMQCLTAGLFLGTFAACNPDKPLAETGRNAVEAGTGAKGNLSIAYVNLDSLEANYEFFQDKKKEFEKTQASMDAEIQRLSKSFQNEVAAFQKKAQSGTLTQSEGQELEQRLAKMQQNVETRSQNLSMELMKAQEKFNRELQGRLDTFLGEYNAEGKYDFIFSHVKGTTLLWANEAYDITKEVVDGLNARYRKVKVEGDKKSAAE